MINLRIGKMIVIIRLLFIFFIFFSRMFFVCDIIGVFFSAVKVREIIFVNSRNCWWRFSFDMGIYIRWIVVGIL